MLDKLFHIKFISHEKMGKGVTLTKEEVEKLKKII